jgi:hypothetical protein
MALEYGVRIVYQTPTTEIELEGERAVRVSDDRLGLVGVDRDVADLDAGGCGGVNLHACAGVVAEVGEVADHLKCNGHDVLSLVVGS